MKNFSGITTSAGMPTSTPGNACSPFGQRRLTRVLIALGFTIALSVGVTEAAEISGDYKIKVKQSGKYLHVSGGQGSDQLASTRIQSNDDYSKFSIKANADGTYTIYSKGNKRPLHVDAQGDQYASTRAVQEDDYTKFFLEPQNDGTHKIRLKATKEYLHVDGEGNNLMTTAIQFDDGYSRYVLEKIGGTPQPGGGPVAAAVTGQNLASVQIYSGNQQTGTLRETAPKRWEWQEGQNRYPWQEERRTESSVFLSSNGSFVEINLPQEGLFGSNATFRTGDKFYVVKNPVAKVKTPAPSSSPASVFLTNVGNQPLSVIELNGTARRNLGVLAAGAKKNYATSMGRALIVNGPDGKLLANIPVNTPAQGRPLGINMRTKPPLVNPMPASNAVKFEPEWYETRDQKFSSQAGKRPGAATWASAPKQVPNMEHNLKGYYFPKMNPYDLQVKGTSTELNFFERISFNSPDFITEDASYPKSFFYKRARNGKFTKTGQMFFSESERQKSMATSASVSASGYGVSVGLAGRYGTDKATTSGEENASVFASGYGSRYWLVLNKRNTKLTGEFRNRLMSSRNPRQFMENYGSHYPLGILYGFRGFYDEKINKKNFSQKATESWGVSANAGGGAFGVDLAVAASHDQSSTSGSTKKQFAGECRTDHSWRSGDR